MSTSPSHPHKTIAFFGASTGVGLAALKRALAAGHTCIALCRTPSKLLDKLPAADREHPNLKVVQGDAHDLAAVTRCCLQAHAQDGEGSEGGGKGKKPVDVILSSIGGVFQFPRMTLDDPHVCERGMATLLEAVTSVRQQQQQEQEGEGEGEWTPRIVVVSTCGMARHRDYPLATFPMYKFLLRVPHADKIKMERALVAGAGYTYTIVRPSLLVDAAAPQREIRVGVDDEPAVGYTISRDDVGGWIYESVLDKGGFGNRIVTVTW